MKWFLLMICVLFLYVICTFFLRQVWNWALFRPSKLYRNVHIPYSALSIDGLDAWFIKSTASQGIKTKRIFIFCHGNAGNISDRQFWLKLFRKIGNVIIFDYSGYGKSDGVPTPKQIFIDGQKIYDYVKKFFDPQDIILVGNSLGGAVAIEVAGNNKCGGLILMATFSNLSVFVPWFLQFTCPVGFDNLQKIKNMYIPTLIMHSSEDELIPMSEGRLLFNAINGYKKFIPVTGSHSTPNVPNNFAVTIHKFLTETIN